MRKYIIKLASSILVFCIVLFSAVGCKQKAIDPQVVVDGSNKPFETHATVSYRDMDLDMRLVRQGSDFYEIEVLSPETVKGMSFIYGEGNLKVKYKGLAFNVDPEIYPAQMMADMIIDAMNSALTVEGISINSESDTYMIEGKCISGSFALDVDPQTGNMISLNVPSENFQADFTNFTFLPDSQTIVASE